MKIIIIVLILLLNFSPAFSCPDVTGDYFVNEEDVVWIKEYPQEFWEKMSDLKLLNEFLQELWKSYDSSCFAAVTINVKEFGALGNGMANDGPVFQKALDVIREKGGGSLFIPAGNYLIDQTLLIANNTEVYGEGEKTVLLRGNTKSFIPMYGGNNFCEKNVGYSGRVLFWNDHYNCGNENIYIHNFAVNGGLITDVPEGNTVTLSFSAVKNLKISTLYLKDVPQDGIFVRNGGQGTTIVNNTIDGFNMRWYNGGGINIEMHGEGNYPVGSQAPVRVENNTLVVRSSSYCAGSETKQCSSHKDCVPSTCGVTENWIPKSNVVGILFTWIKGSSPPLTVIRDNIVQVTNFHVGIACHGCRDSIIEGNVVESLNSGNFLSGLFSGIVSDHPAGGSGSNITIHNNSVKGSGRSHDGRGIHLSSNDPIATKGIISNNNVMAKNTGLGLAPVKLTGYQHFQIMGNEITEVGEGPGLEIGASNCESGWRITEDGVVSNNKVTLITQYDPVLLRRVRNVQFDNNFFLPNKEAKVIC